MMHTVFLLKMIALNNQDELNMEEHVQHIL